MPLNKVLKEFYMKQFDKTILSALADKMFTPQRVTAILRELKSRMNAEGGDNIKDLQKQLEIVRVKIVRLYDAIEDGCIAHYGDTKARMDSLKKRRAEVTAKIENYNHSPQAILYEVDPAEVKAWSAMLREKLLDQSSGFSKEYLQLLVKEIVLQETKSPFPATAAPWWGQSGLPQKKRIR